VSARLAALAMEVQHQQQVINDLVAAHEAVVRLASVKLARWELAASTSPAQ
jgi:DNA-binding TFAR19-related protein (PDSD5 family)